MIPTHLRPHYSGSREAAGLVFLSGIMSFDADRQIIGKTIGAQTRNCLAKIAEVLGRSGLGLEHIVKTTAWITRAEDFADFNAAYAEVMGQSLPARSTVVSQLVADGLLIEIEVIAARPN